MKQSSSQPIDAGNTTTDTPTRVFTWIVSVGLVISPMVFKTGIVKISDAPQFTVILLAFGLAVAGLGATALLNGSRLTFRIFEDRASRLLLGVLLLFLIYSGLSAFWVTSGEWHWEQWRQWGIAIGLAFFVCVLPLTRSQLLFLLSAFIVGASGNAALALGQFWLDAVPEHVVKAPAGAFVNGNFAASYTSMALVAAFSMWCGLQNKKHRWLLLLAMLLLALQVFHSFARASWAASVGGIVLVSLLFLIGLLRSPELRLAEWVRLRWAGFLALLVLFLIGTNFGEGKIEPRLAQAYERITTTIEVEDPTGSPEGQDQVSPGEMMPRDRINLETSLAGRLAYWENSLYLVKDAFPLGVGEGNFQVHFPKYSSKPNVTVFNTRDLNLRYLHNDYLETVIEHGLIGVFCILSLGLVVVSAVYRLVAKRFEAEQGVVLLAATGGLLAVAINVLASSALNWPTHKVASGLLAGVLAAALSSSRCQRKQLSSNIFASLLLLAGLAVSVFGVRGYAQQVRGETLYLQAGKDYAAGKREQALNKMLEASQLIPHYNKVAMTTGALLLDAGRPEEALEYMQQVEKKHPYGFRNNQNLAKTHIALGEKEKAIAVYERMLAAIPHDLDTQHRLAVVLRDKNWERSDKLLEAAISTDEASAFTYILLAENYMLQNKQAQAARTLVEGGELFPQDKRFEQTFKEYGFEVISIQ